MRIIYLTVVFNNTNRSTKDIKKFEYEYEWHAKRDEWRKCICPKNTL